jgi:hypothetical protein
VAASSTYTPIATTTLGADAASYTFTSIPSTYTDLRVVISCAVSNQLGSLAVQFNSDTSTGSTNYSQTDVYGTGTATGSSRTTNTYSIYPHYNITEAGTLGQTNTTLDFMNYSNTTTYKTMISRGNSVGGTYPGTTAVVGLWRSTAAITAIKFWISGNYNYLAGSTFTLYGIQSA